MTHIKTRALAGALIAFSSVLVLAQEDLINWETPHVHPLELSHDGTLLLAVNTPDNRLEVFDVSGGTPSALYDCPVGLDPVSVRVRADDSQAWVVNHVSDTISVVELATGHVSATLSTDDEPCDVVFAGTPERAFVSCSQANSVQVFDPANLSVAPLTIPIEGEDPRAMAVSNDGSTVYVAVFESGNGTTSLGGGVTTANVDPPNVVSNPDGPWGGQNPPPNSGAGFSPALNPANPAPPAVALIVKQDDNGSWFDDNGGDWTSLVSGADAALSGRPVGWELLDHDVVSIDASTLAVSYQGGLMNLCMALAVHPASGHVAVVGTEATNELRFEPLLNGRFVRVELASFDPTGAGSPMISDLNSHLDYSSSSVAQSERDKSLGDPRGIAWNATGSAGWVTGMGSNNVLAIDASGARTAQPPIEVGEGPTGIVWDELNARVYVLAKFEAAISVIDPVAGSESLRVPFFDPSPAAIKTGRKHLYDTHATSGLGQSSCASCHIDARMDRLAWDLGDPAGDMQPFAGNCPDGGCQDWHPMKGPMMTQTLQDIIGKEPHHWRGDRTGLEEFNAAFQGLLGDDQQLSPAQMQEFEDFLATIHFPPNAFRNVDNSLPTGIALPGHYTSGRFAPEGLPLPDGDATRGLQLFRPPNLLDGVACATCHTLPIGIGTDNAVVGFNLVPIPPGPDGERHHQLVSVDGFTNVTQKTPQLRNMYDKVGCERSQLTSTQGFGFAHDGSVDSLARFVSEPLFAVASDQDVADLVAFMLAFSGSELPSGNNVLEPPGTASLDTHAGVGTQVMLDGVNYPSLPIFALELLADAGDVGLVAKGLQLGERRGYAYLGAGQYQSDRWCEVLSSAALQAAAAPGSELVWTIVPAGSEQRIGIDRDRDGQLDRDEHDAGSDAGDAGSVPLGPQVFCTPKLTSNGCLPQIAFSGSPSSVDPTPFLITASQVLNGKNGLLFYGYGTQAGTPFLGGTLCAQPPLRRLPLQNSLGSPPPANDCSGVYGFDFNARIQGGADALLVPGQEIGVQWWLRDPQQTDGTGVGLTDALGFHILGC